MMLKLRILDMKRFLQVLDTCSTRVQIVEPDGTHSCPIYCLLYTSDAADD